MLPGTLLPSSALSGTMLSEPRLCRPASPGSGPSSDMPPWVAGPQGWAPVGITRRTEVDRPTDLAGGVTDHGSSPSGFSAVSHGGVPDIRVGRTPCDLGAGGTAPGGGLAVPFPAGMAANGPVSGSGEPGYVASAAGPPGNGGSAHGTSENGGSLTRVPAPRVSGE